MENRVCKYTRIYLSIKIFYENDINNGKLLKIIENHKSTLNFVISAKKKKTTRSFHMKNILRKRVNNIFIKIVNCVHTWLNLIQLHIIIITSPRWVFFSSLPKLL